MLKRFISLTLSTLLVLAACLTAPVTALAEGPLLLTQDFENYTVGSNYATVSTEVYRSESHSLYFKNKTDGSSISYDANGNGWARIFSQEKTPYLKAGSTYRLTFWAYKNATSNGSPVMGLEYSQSNASSYTENPFLNISLSGKAETWTMLTKDFTATKDGYLVFRMQNWNSDKTMPFTEAYIDDVVLEERVPVTVSYVTNSDDVIDGMTDYPGAPLTLPTPTTKVLGKAFAGWYTDAVLTQPYTESVYPAGNTTLYAKWGPLAGFVQNFSAENWQEAGNHTIINSFDTSSSKANKYDLIHVEKIDGADVLHYEYDGLERTDAPNKKVQQTNQDRIIINPPSTSMGNNSLKNWLSTGDAFQVTVKYKVLSGKVKLTVAAGINGDRSNGWLMRDQIATPQSAELTATEGWQTLTKSLTVKSYSEGDVAKTIDALMFCFVGTGELYIDEVEVNKVPTGVETAYNGVAAIRAANETANVKQGFRLYNRVNKQWLEDYNIVEFGALAIRKARLAEGATLNVSTENVAKGVAWQKDGNQSLWEDLGDSYSFTAVLIGIREKFYAEDYSVVTYAKDASDNYIYGEVQDLCVFNVVDSILSSSSAAEADRSTANAVIAQAAAAAAEDESVVTYEAWKTAQAGQTA